MRTLQDAPFLRCGDRGTLELFCRKYGIRSTDRRSLIGQVATAFSLIPYENLTKIIKSDGVLDSSSAVRFPDEVIGDHLRWGTGGTCFSLTAAIIAVFDALGIEAQPLLADRNYGPDTHCGMMIMEDRANLLLDPGYLLFSPTPLPTIAATRVFQGYTTIELVPKGPGNRIELATIVKNSRKVRLTYKLPPADPETFYHAWITSFTWEMMTYPVLTRCIAGQHMYMQGASTALRTAEKTVRRELDIDGQISCIDSFMGISREVVLRAWRVIGHGAS